MDDAKGVVRPDSPARYTMYFSADKRVAMQLNCNRASGTWTAENAASGSASGSIKFGPLAMTKMFCPQPSIDDRIARDMDHVRSYVFKDGRLHLTLEAAGGVYVWEPNSR